MNRYIKQNREPPEKGELFRSVCVAIFSSIACLHFENRMTVCMEYLARTSKGSEPDNAAGRGQEAHAGRTANLPGCYSFVGVGFLPTPK